MTIGQLIMACDNIKPDTEFMVFDSVEDYDNCTSNWKTYTAISLVDSPVPITRFRIYSDFVAAALA